MPRRRLSASMSKRKAAVGKLQRLAPSSKKLTASDVSRGVPKRVRSGVATPRSIDEHDSDEYTEDTSGAISETEAEDYAELVTRYSVGTYSKKKTADTFDSASHLFASRDHVDLPLKPDHTDRPLWIDPNRGRIIMESFSPTFKSAENF